MSPFSSLGKIKSSSGRDYVSTGTNEKNLGIEVGLYTKVKASFSRRTPSFLATLLRLLLADAPPTGRWIDKMRNLTNVMGAGNWQH